MTTDTNGTGAAIRGPILVTGAAGFIGWYLTRALRRQGHDVLAVDDLSASPWRQPLPGIAVRDVCSLEAPHLAGIRSVVHLATRKVVPTSFTDREQIIANVRVDRHVIDLIAAARPEVAILASSCEVYGAQPTPLAESAPLRPRSPYAVGKVALELLADVYRPLTPTRICVARLFNIYGPGEGLDAVVPRFVHDALVHRRLLIEGCGTQRRDLTYIDDLVAALVGLLALPVPPAVVNIGSGRSVSVLDLAARIGAAVGGVGLVHGAARTNEIPGFVADTRHLRDVLPGWRATVDLATGLARCIAWERRQQRPAAVRQDLVA
jgi:dTDP-glucose 4,6-dehydratase/UDP-glucose 4-epimerase